MEAGVGIAVFVRCFVHKKSMEADIVDRLGNGFSLAPFASVVVCFMSNGLFMQMDLLFYTSLKSHLFIYFFAMQGVCTVVSILACVPLGELFLFHFILMRKVWILETHFSVSVISCSIVDLGEVH